MTMRENVKTAMRDQRDRDDATCRLLAVIKVRRVGLPDAAMETCPADLSGVRRKRAGFARAIVPDPGMVFRDEPLARPDPNPPAAFDRPILHLQAALGLATFLVPHDPDSLVAICDRIAVLSEMGKGREHLERPVCPRSALGVVLPRGVTCLRGLVTG